MQPLCIINENSRAANYGIGTYICQLVEAVKDMPYRVYVVNLRDTTYKLPVIEDKEKIKYIYIPTPQHTSGDSDYKKVSQRYYRNVLYLLKLHLEPNLGETILFHFNFFNAPFLAKLLKQHFNCYILLTVHYMNWSFELLGNTEKLKKALEKPETDREERIKNGVETEKQFINECCDQVIAIARHSFNTLRDVYLIPEEKIVLIPNGLEDMYTELSKRERTELRQQYHFAESEKIIVFAGRLDPVKGLSLLIAAFKKIMEQDDSVRLIIAGDGNMNKYFQEASLFWSRITFTGFISKEHLYNLYQIADIGVLPSLHEEFGYVAIEMMMMHLPLVVGQTTGLAELVENGENGITVPLHYTDENDVEAITRLQHAIISLLYAPERMKMRENARKRFVENYSLNKFRLNIRNTFNYYSHIN